MGGRQSGLKSVIEFVLGRQLLLANSSVVDMLEQDILQEVLDRQTMTLSATDDAKQLHPTGGGSHRTKKQSVLTTNRQRAEHPLGVVVVYR